MALSGKQVKSAIPYIPEIERNNTSNPCVIWILPKNVLGTHKSLERFSKAQDMVGRKASINPAKLFEADVKDFLEFCQKIDNFEFPDEFPEYKSRGIATFQGEAELRAVMQVLDPNIFQEMQNASANWSMLTEGETAYRTWKDSMKPEIKK